MKWRILSVSIFFVFTSGCATYEYVEMKQVRMIAASEDAYKSADSGPIEGKKCMWHIFRRPLGEAPTLQQALNNATINRNESSWESVGFENTSEEALQLNEVRLISNLTVDNSGFDLGIIGKQCINVTGIGYL